MLDYNTPEYVPSSEELPCSDDTPVDNELQNRERFDELPE